MKIPISRFKVDAEAYYSAYNPLLLFAQKYLFGPGEQCELRICYANAIVLIEKGSGTLLLKDQLYRVGPGSLVYIAAGAVHQWKADYSDPMIQRCVYFDWSFIHRADFHYQSSFFEIAGEVKEQYIAASPPLKLREVTQTNNIPMWVSYFNAQIQQPDVLGTRPTWDFLKVNGAFQLFLHHFLTYAIQQEAIFDPRIQKLLSYIDQSPLDLSEKKLYEWAEELGLGKSRLHELFKKNTGYTPSNYLKQLKFQLISEELCYSNITITDIAEKYGFSSIHYFSKIFRRMTGLSPTSYKEKYRIQH